MREQTAPANTGSEREFEMLLGNKQLFSVLFLVFVLMGVFFAMGYSMGRNSLPVEAAKQSVPTYPLDRTSSASTDSSSPVTNEEADRGERAASGPPPVISAPEVRRSETPAAVPEARRPATRTQESSPVTVTDPRPGQSFLQVMASAKPEAELLVEVLSKKGFRALLAPGPTAAIFRVLVGPLQDAGDLSRTRTELEKAGLRPIPRKY